MSSLDALRDAVRVSPENVPLLLLYAQGCLEHVLADEARAAYERILARDPAHYEARLGIARVLYLTARNSEAAVRLESLLDERPGDSPALRLLARVLLAEENREGAKDAYRRSLEAAGATPDAELESILGGPPPAAAAPKPTRIDTAGADVGDEDDRVLDRALLEERVEKASEGFDGVGGMETVKEEIQLKILYPIRHPELYRAYGKTAGGGVLMFGPPGCGKTLLARAIAGEAGSRFLSVGLHEILDLYLGNSEKALHELFETARRNRPCTLFFDEVDALAASRSDLRRSAGRTLVNQLLAELDGSQSSNEGVLVVGATNAPWHMDSAFLRPGRFDRVLFVPPPDEAARAVIVGILARGRPMAELDAPAIARKTPEYSGADLRNVFDVATERCLAEALKKGSVVPLTTKALLAAAGTVRPTTRAWFDNARNFALYSNAGGLYDGVLTYLGIRK
ncbi:MAG TPA: AAA family ATPase [Candidatus Eisenbacteria bacterium]|nr:AAA family ATPase [Candidatus Eisenbacteria bacterium]